LGQHASGVCKALLRQEYGDLTKADLDAGFSTVEQIKDAKILEWARKDVEKTREQLKAFWKDI
jgi:hypothetical protein